MECDHACMEGGYACMEAIGRFQGQARASIWIVERSWWIEPARALVASAGLLCSLHMQWVGIGSMQSCLR